MSIKQPKPVQIRLPFSVPKPNRSTAQPKACGICRKRDSRYTCPRCNVLYCSLDCFQDKSHAQCSEPFYRSSVLSSISTDPTAGIDEKKGMLEMLRRFEEAQAEGEGALEELRQLEGEEEDDDELLEKLRDVDLDSIDSNALFHLLPPKHRDAFIQALKNPESELTRNLLAEAAEEQDEGRDGPSVLPWWERSLETDGDDEDEDEDEDEDGGAKGDGESEEGEDVNAPAKLECAPLPPAIPNEVLEGISPPDGVGKKLVYNAIAMCVAYFHTLLSFRLPSLDSTYLAEANLEPSEVREYVGSLVPFLVQPRSTTRYESLGDAWASVWEAVAVGADTPTPPSTQTLIHLISLLPAILHPPILAPSHPQILYLLADLYRLFSDNDKLGPTARKLGFYVVALRRLERRDWLAIERKVGDELDKLREESGDQEDASGGDGLVLSGEATQARREKLELL